VEDEGEIVAANQLLEVTFLTSPQDSKHTIVFKECGTAVLLLIPFLERYYSDNVSMCYMEKWVHVITQRLRGT
jgi:hypothetical protein